MSQLKAPLFFFSLSYKIIGYICPSGLNIAKTMGRNIALLGCFTWRAMEDDRPWSQVLRQKYVRNNAICRTTGLNRIALQIGAHICSLGSKWSVGEGNV